MTKLNIDFHYPQNSKYIFETKMNKINIDEKREEIINNGKGFVVSKAQSKLRKEFDNEFGIFSSRFGRTLQDVNSFGDKYKCRCGYLTERIHSGITCPLCGEKVKFVDDDFGYFAWIVLKDPYYIMHPNLYKEIKHFFYCDKTDNLDCILKPQDEKDIDGHTVLSDKNDNYKYHGIGLLEFKEKFEEIMKFYLKKNPNKKQYYDDIMESKDKVFIQSIPVFTVHLRQYKIDGNKLKVEKTNSLYIMMTKLAADINKDTLKIYRKKKPKNQLLYDLNNKYLELYDEIIKILSGKKGNLRNVFGGRYNFSSRSVIIPNPKLRIDEVVMPYKAMVELLAQSIINILVKSYNITYAQAHSIWTRAQLVKDERVYKIIKGLIKDKERGIPILINRNPTIK